MSSFGVSLPLELDSVDGFVMLKSVKRLIKQNFKMLLLTNPGERVMEPDFGVGIKQFLFQNFGSGTEAQIDSKIRKQVNIYLPIINVNNISFGSTDPDNNHLGFAISYSIPDLGATDLLEFTI